MPQAGFNPALPSGATRTGYPQGPAGIRMSLEAMCRKIREGRVDPGVRGWANQALKDAGIDGRSGQSVYSQATAILNALRSQVVYSPDPYGAEYIVGAAATLCLKPNLCLNGGDCDDLSVALASLMLSVGIPTQIVKQNFGPDKQEHVLTAIYDGNEWQYADPSLNMSVGSAVPAVSEVWVDPMGPVGNMADSAPEIITLGRPPTLGATTTPAASTSTVQTTLTTTPSQITGYVLVTLPVQTVPGLRYRIGFNVNVLNTDYVTNATQLQADLQTAFSQNFLVEILAPTGDTTGADQSWLFQGIATTAQLLSTTATSSTDSTGVLNLVSYEAAAVQSSTATPSANPTGPTGGPVIPPLVPLGNVPVGVALVIGALAASTGGLLWAYYAKKGRRR